MNEPDVPKGQLVQTIKFFVPITVRNGEKLTLRNMPVINSNGELLEGEFMAEVGRDKVVRIIGKG